MKKLKDKIPSLFHPLVNAFFISMMFVFMNCGLLSGLIPGIDGLTNDETSGTMTIEEAMELCSTVAREKQFENISDLPGTRVFTFDDSSSVSVSYCNSFASFKSELKLSSPGKVSIADNRDSIEGATIGLGVFQERMELVFAIDVEDTGYTYYTGPASRNPDGLVHAAVYEIEPGLIFIGFEDVFGGGDEDYDDINFIVNIGSAD